MSKYLIVIAGPTAVGKTTAAIQLAQHFDCPILSADSRQIYKEMNIGTAKPSKIELESAKHHFIDHVSIHEPYNAGKYEREVITLLDDIYSTKNMAILCGGTGMYINAVLEGLDEFPETTKAIDNHYESLSIPDLQAELKIKDPKYYDQVDIQNRRRMSRALSVIKSSGKTFSSFRTSSPKKRNFTPIYIFINMDREKLYQRINYRVDLMIQNGLESEAKSLFPFVGLRSLDTVGYRELFDYFNGDITLDKAIELIKRNSRRYAKRQLTWHRSKPQWKAFEPLESDKMVRYITEFIK